MYPIDPKVISGVWCALALLTAGQDAAPNGGDRLQAETAARLGDFKMNNNMGDPHRPMSPEMDSVAKYPDLLNDLTAEVLAKMSLDDPLLKWAYANVFLRSMGPFEQLEPPLEMVLADMRRRGDAVSPMFLKLIEENRETRIESSVLGKIEYLDTVRLDPFLEYARKLLRERPNSDVVAVASGLLARKGTKEDIVLLEWLLEQRPFAVTDATGNLKALRERLNTLSESRPERRAFPSSSARRETRPGKCSENHPQDGGITTSRTRSWLISGMILMALYVMYRLLRKSQRGQS